MQAGAFMDLAPSFLHGWGLSSCSVSELPIDIWSTGHSIEQDPGIQQGYYYGLHKMWHPKLMAEFLDLWIWTRTTQLQLEFPKAENPFAMFCVYNPISLHGFPFIWIGVIWTQSR